MRWDRKPESTQVSRSRLNIEKVFNGLEDQREVLRETKWFLGKKRYPVNLSLKKWNMPDDFLTENYFHSFRILLAIR